MNILLSVDGSDYTRRMLSYIAAHNELLGAGHTYTALTVVSAIPALALPFLDVTAVANCYGDEAEKILKPVQAFAAQQGWTLNVASVQGPAAESIADFARENKSDLIIMGAHGHSAVLNMVLGSVTTGVLARCTTPVLLIR